MIKAFYTASAGAQSTQQYLDVISNNMANMQTNGYKSQRGEFSDLLYTNIHNNNQAIVGSGSRLDKTNTNYTSGTLVQTGHKTDFALPEDGFFGVMKNDEIYYTKTGNFTVGNIDGEDYLMLDGCYVLDDYESPIIIEDINNDINLAVYKFTNNNDLERAGDNLFKLTNEFAEYEIVENPDVKRGFIEGSNVNMLDEMVGMLKSQRAFQLNSKVIQTADEIEQVINSLSN